MGVRVRNVQWLSSCRDCGRPILWATNSRTGKRVPVDPFSQTYDVHEVGYGRFECDPAPGAAVVHFDTCPARRKNRARKPIREIV